MVNCVVVGRLLDDELDNGSILDDDDEREDGPAPNVDDEIEDDSTLDDDDELEDEEIAAGDDGAGDGVDEPPPPPQATNPTDVQTSKKDVANLFIFLPLQLQIVISIIKITIQYFSSRSNTRINRYLQNKN